MGLLLILFWCAAVVGRRETSNILSDNSRFGAFISRLGRRKFPACAATGTRVQGIDLAYRFHGEMAVIRGKSTKFPVSTGKTGNFVPLAERAVTQPPDNDADLRFSEPIVPLFANRGG